MIILEQYTDKTPIIVSVDEEEEITIKDVAYLIAKGFNYENNIIFNESYSDGQYKKTADNSKLKKIINNYKFVSITNGISDTINWFVNNYNTCRK